MSCLFWNYQGIGSLLTVHALGDILRHYRPDVIFLAETKGMSHNIEKLKRSWNLNGVSVDRVGLSGGLAMLWRKEIQLNLLSFPRNHVDTMVRFEDGGPDIRVTGIYGEPEAQQRELTWNLIRTLHAQHTRPWFLGGDFNEILHNSEKQGGILRNPASLEAFGNALSDCSLMGLDFLGNPFTWSNHRAAPHNVRGRLDRVCSNGSCNSLFPMAVVNHLEYAGSDHLPLLLQLVRPQPPRDPHRRKPFRFEAMWIRKAECLDIVCKVWESELGADPMLEVMHKGDECKIRLMRWSKARDPDSEIKQVRKRKMDLKTGLFTEEAKVEYDRLEHELENLYNDQATYWRQRGKKAWMKDGDKNTSYFHAKASIRERVNKIVGLRNGVGTWITDKGQMQAVGKKKISMIIFKAFSGLLIQTRGRWTSARRS